MRIKSVFPNQGPRASSRHVLHSVLNSVSIILSLCPSAQLFRRLSLASTLWGPHCIQVPVAAGGGYCGADSGSRGVFTAWNTAPLPSPAQSTSCQWLRQGDWTQAIHATDANLPPCTQTPDMFVTSIMHTHTGHQS